VGVSTGDFQTDQTTADSIEAGEEAGEELGPEVAGPVGGGEAGGILPTTPPA
jgi:hypothetical protein